MPNTLIEENGKYGIDCKKALWASDDIHAVYHDCGLPEILCDTDFAVETDDKLLLIEYKNASIPEALAHAGETVEYDPMQQDKIRKIIKKYYDSLHYLRLCGKDKPIHFIFVLEYPKGDSTSRKMLRNRLKKYLPFKLQDKIGAGIRLIDAVNVMNIAEWNADENYGQFPILPVEKLGA